MKNKYINKNKFFNTKRGKHPLHFFYLPTLIKTKERMVRWELISSSYTLVLFSFFYQINVYRVTLDSNKEIFKQDVVNILKILKDENLVVNSVDSLVKYLEANLFLISIVKNIDTQNPYSQKVILSYLKECNFVVPNN